MCGELIFTVFAAIAKFQRQQIIKGTREGLDAARARGRIGGRPRALAPEQITDARILLSAGQPEPPSPPSCASPAGHSAAPSTPRPADARRPDGDA
ncbi:recombinase family protein [Micromonospora sp. MW-13]|uniref:recombinase family protein n=1 Tax=Micromonospora sp. MW-13 TaxID=2094022 RepID=UPI000E43F298|nr:recombinase family protein [Micromonospora sp. MW-13]